MSSTQQTRLPIRIIHRAQIRPNNLKLRILPHIILRHLKHAQMQIRDRAEGPASDEDERCFGRILENGLDAVVREAVG